jgi:hypothetical protein
MTCAHAAAQELAPSAKAAELNEWGRQRARIEDEQRELKRRDTPVDFMELNNRTCRWPLFEGHEPFYEKLYCGARTSSGSPYCAAHAGQAFTRRTFGRAEAANTPAPQAQQSEVLQQLRQPSDIDGNPPSLVSLACNASASPIPAAEP